MSDLGQGMANAVMGLIAAAIIGGLVIGGLIMLAAVYAIPWVYHHVSVSVG